ncbi:hypothetical protein COLO4_10482 [Corchorus olitorius]|uniref:Cullin N-terminal domain-containing protein n=1 Tax=Corchorus olitorius TaxID=93759 RepID=A0A1R3K8C8_9ROSI|nr:hypothetical protein COLO4_10482 [Corchorus olitorius]
MDEAITKAKKIIEGYPETKFSGEEYQRFYDCVYFMCTYHSSDEKTMQLYQKFRNSLEESIHSTVLPTLINKHGAHLLREFIVMWSNYKLMARWLCRFFEYLDRFFIPQNGELESLHGISFTCFHKLVFKKLIGTLFDAALTLICQEREGLQIDYILLKNVVDMFVEFGDSDYGGSNYYQDFEMKVLADNSNYYSRLASEWLPFDSSTEYINKVFWCLNREKQSASHYLHPGSEAMILQNVRYHLLHKVANKLIEKKQAENSGLVTDHQEMLSKCAGMSLQEGSSSTSSEEWLSKLMESSARIG